MQDFYGHQPSEKDIVQPGDISNAKIEKCLDNFVLEFVKYVDVGLCRVARNFCSKGERRGGKSSESIFTCNS
ncbi:hypothetical protein TNCV_3531041 [Trichonephila clavipes]|uniref:Uncharacterized protein n=1 Tax=Trichonephila clavipes TaxID=2585209 RepID=A0A8X6SXD9_TRICX|nr:hypothetical protein TNCV_3531041 [Trichonephila clavipes]